MISIDAHEVIALYVVPCYMAESVQAQLLLTKFNYASDCVQHMLAPGAIMC